MTAPKVTAEKMQVETMTKRQREVYEFLIRYQKERGRPPTLRDICQEFRFRSPQAAVCHLKPLMEKGFVEREAGVARGLRVVPLEPLPEPFVERGEAVGEKMAGEPSFGVLRVGELRWFLTSEQARRLHRSLGDYLNQERG